MKDLARSFRRWLLNYRAGDGGAPLTDDDLEIAYCAGHAEAKDYVEQVKSELAEQCRLNGMDSQRELALMTKVSELNAEIDELKNQLIRAEVLMNDTKMQVSKEMETLRSFVLADKVNKLESALEIAEVALRTCKNDYWIMTNLIEKYSSDKDQTLNDCAERMKFRKPVFNVLESIAKLRGGGE